MLRGGVTGPIRRTHAAHDARDDDNLRMWLLKKRRQNGLGDRDIGEVVDRHQRAVNIQSGLAGQRALAHAAVEDDGVQPAERLHRRSNGIGHAFRVRLIERDNGDVIGTSGGGAERVQFVEATRRDDDPRTAAHDGRCQSFTDPAGCAGHPDATAHPRTLKHSHLLSWRVLPRRITIAFAGVLVSLTGLVWTSAIAQEPPPYQVIAADGTRALPIARRAGTTDFVALDALQRFFSITMREDPRADGVVISAGTQRVVLTSGQATVSAGGRLVSLSAPVTKDGARWLVPIDFLRVLDPLLNRRIEIRREARLIVIDGVSVPRLVPRFDRTQAGGRLSIAVDPAVPARVSRAGNLVTVSFKAEALDAAALADAPAEVVAGWGGARSARGVVVLPGRPVLRHAVRQGTE